MATARQLAGYLLEEVVCHLLASNGYRLLTKDDDATALVKKSNGLRVKGRGAEHQADALGELDFTIPFSLPIRLFVEAKNTTSKVGLDVVRNAHGVVHDVNEYVRATTDVATKPEHLRRVQYRYSIFATGGFTADAQSFALAHQISLVDLSGPSWQALAATLRKAARQQTVSSDLRTPSVRSARIALRYALARTAGDRRLLKSTPINQWAAHVAEDLLDLDEDQELFLGFTDAPFVLPLRSRDPQAFRRYLASAQRGPLRIHIGFDRRGSKSGEWRIQDLAEPDAFDLTFALPGVLEQLLLGSEDGYRQAARAAKQSLLSTITVYLDGAPVRMHYERSHMSAGPRPLKASDRSPLREARVPLRDRTHPETPTTWTRATAEELLNRLATGQYIQHELIRWAAEHGGRITREDIYAIAGYEEGRKLNGLVKPVNRITKNLIDERLLSDNAEQPFDPEYEAGLAVAYRVSSGMLRALNTPG